MSRRVLASALLLFISPLVACNLGSQKFDVSIDGKPQEFNEGVTASGVTSGDTFELRVPGSSDPIKNAIDDESSLALTIQFDKAALDALPRDQALRIHGLTSLTLVGRIPYANTRADSRTNLEALVQIDTL